MSIEKVSTRRVEIFVLTTILTFSFGINRGQRVTIIHIRSYVLDENHLNFFIKTYICTYMMRRSFYRIMFLRNYVNIQSPIVFNRPGRHYFFNILFS